MVDDARYLDVLAREFDSLVPENALKWKALQSDRSVWTFDVPDQMVDFAEQNGMQVKGHTLAWSKELSYPGWFLVLPRAEQLVAIRDHIQAVVGRYAGRITAWDVWNEAMANDGSGLLGGVSEDDIADAFRWAREADPDVVLLYNDYKIAGSGRKSDDVFAMLQRLVAIGAPVDGVGFQMHVNLADAPPSGAEVAANMARYEGLGLKVTISEMDVRIADLAGTTDERLEAQADYYRDMVGVCLAAPNCLGVTFWGFTDRYSWIDARHGADDPLLFDEKLVEKPAYFGVLDALETTR